MWCFLCLRCFCISMSVNCSMSKFVFCECLCVCLCVFCVCVCVWVGLCERLCLYVLVRVLPDKVCVSGLFVR